MIRSPIRTGGLILSALQPRRTISAEPLQSGPDISWLTHCRVGDDQGQEGACAIFAHANWAEIMFSKSIPDSDCHAVYQAALQREGRTEADGGGLTFQAAFDAAFAAGWLPGCRGLTRVYDLSILAQQPLLAGYEIGPAFDNVNPDGCLDHATRGPARGHHAVCIVGSGCLAPNPDRPLVYIENSWGASWGHSGLAVMTAALHASICRELWTIRL